MSTLAQVRAYIQSQEEPRRGDMQALHRLARKLLPRGRVWFLDGKAVDGRTVSNPQVGYGAHRSTLASGKTREMFQIGFSANGAGISVYLMGLEDKALLARQFGKRIGRATVTGYCIRFRSLDDIDIDVLAEAMRHAIGKGARVPASR